MSYLHSEEPIIWNAAVAVFHAIPHDLLYCISRIFFTVFEMPSLMIFFTVFLGSLLTFVFFFYSRVISKKKTPPGTFGWPLIGETLNFMGCHHRGSPHEFFHSRTQKYGNLFTTSILGYPTVVFGSPQGSRFLFANENKLVVMSWPRSIVKLFGNSLINVTGDDAKRVRRMLMTFLRPEALQKFVGRLDSITKRHLAEQWIGKNELTVFPLIKEFAFSVACDLLATISDHDDVERISLHFMELLKGLVQLPIDVPGTRYNKAKHAANAIREQLDGIIGERRIALQEGKASPQQDLLSFLLSNVDHQSEDESLTDDEIKDNFLLLLFAGHDTSTSTLTALLKFLAENPICYEQVLKEQLEIAGSKEAGQLLEWEDVQKMKYSWRTVQESMRLMPSAQGGFRKAMQDFTYDGYTIPRGWKTYWTVHSTNRKAEYFSNPEKFDPSRFEGAGPPPYTFLPFGGGPRMCPGIEFARMEILVFLHNAVKNFKWTLVDPSEKFTVDPMPAPVDGLPIKLFPR